MPCSQCGNPVDRTLKQYIDNKNKRFFCNVKCKSKYSENKIDIKCDNCGKTISVTPWEMKKRNQNGNSNHFCSQDCYWEYRGKHYIGENAPMYKHQYTIEQYNNVVGAVTANAKLANRNTSIQLMVNDILNSMNIEYVREYSIGYYFADNFLKTYNLVIEVMGDYWHGNPLKFNEKRYGLNHIQSNTILKDKQKKTYLLNKCDIPILYLWESDIKSDSGKMIQLISKFISSNGMFDYSYLYHSFNYVMIDDNLIVNDFIITPYQDMKSEKYKHIVYN